MKKKLLLVIVMTGILVSASFSVFADTYVNPFCWMTSGHNGDDTVSYYAVLKGYETSYVLDLNITNLSSDERAVFNNSYFNVSFTNSSARSTSYNYASSITAEPAIFVADFEIEDYYLDNSGIMWMDFDFTFFIQDAVLEPSESRNYHIYLSRFEPNNNYSVSLTVSIPNTTAESSPSYEATVTANDIASQEQVIHQQEVTWYQQNEQAINQVGLDNFNFGAGTLSGLQVIQQHFGDIWNALGDLNLIYTFTLMISLATFIIRHMPNTKRPDPNEDALRDHDFKYKAVQRLKQKYGNH